MDAWFTCDLASVTIDATLGRLSFAQGLDQELAQPTGRYGIGASMRDQAHVEGLHLSLRRDTLALALSDSWRSFLEMNDPVRSE
ncbi:hypothetical protein D2V17_16230 [Aurantiacibacter xanthus]|uniref:Uncharacterized protein n=1 Tax=Aurantiacibacter xanthus TaxID=1784712 RepID=A0A3A1P4X5_9SPHN|nr:hypothetical protein D2V17_16230 [Aurantiacibacter xanthus]